MRARSTAPGSESRARLAVGRGCLLVAALVTSARGEPPPAATAVPVAAEQGINGAFLSPDLDPEEWLAKFEVESREVFSARREILAAVGLQPGDRIADVGSGTGLFLAAFSAAVGPDGRVFAVDISPRLVEFVEQRIRAEGLGNVVALRSSATSTRLPAGSVTHAFVCDAYHHFERYPEMLASIRAALVPGGRLVIVDFDRIPGVSREWLLTHVRAGKGDVRREIEAAGFVFVADVPVGAFQENYLLQFRSPGQESSPAP